MLTHDPAVNVRLIWGSRWVTKRDEAAKMRKGGMRDNDKVGLSIFVSILFLKDSTKSTKSKTLPG